jgi:hypothetical protein
MAYYAGYEDTPIHSKEHKERNMMDCCMITQIRPVTLMSDTPENAFDVVCVDREWTFCAESKEEMQVWLQVPVARCLAVAPPSNNMLVL